MKEIQIYEVEGTNLLFVVTGRNSDASYYNKSNLEVKAEGGYVLLFNEGVKVLMELPGDFIEPLESSVVDLVERIQGYINNIIEDPSESEKLLIEVIGQNKERNDLLNELKVISKCQLDMLSEIRESNKYLRKIYNPI